MEVDLSLRIQENSAVKGTEEAFDYGRIAALRNNNDMVE